MSELVNRLFSRLWDRVIVLLKHDTFEHGLIQSLTDEKLVLAERHADGRPYIATIPISEISVLVEDELEGPSTQFFSKWKTLFAKGESILVSLPIVTVDEDAPVTESRDQTVYAAFQVTSMDDTRNTFTVQFLPDKNDPRLAASLQGSGIPIRDPILMTFSGTERQFLSPQYPQAQIRVQPIQLGALISLKHIHVGDRILVSMDRFSLAPATLIYKGSTIIEVGDHTGKSKKSSKRIINRDTIQGITILEKHSEKKEEANEKQVNIRDLQVGDIIQICLKEPPSCIPEGKLIFIGSSMLEIGHGKLYAISNISEIHRMPKRSRSRSKSPEEKKRKKPEKRPKPNKPEAESEKSESEKSKKSKKEEKSLIMPNSKSEKREKPSLSEMVLQPIPTISDVKTVTRDEVIADWNSTLGHGFSHLIHEVPELQFLAKHSPDDALRVSVQLHGKVYGFNGPDLIRMKIVPNMYVPPTMVRMKNGISKMRRGYDGKPRYRPGVGYMYGVNSQNKDTLRGWLALIARINKKYRGYIITEAEKGSLDKKVGILGWDVPYISFDWMDRLIGELGAKKSLDARLNPSVDESGTIRFHKCAIDTHTLDRALRFLREHDPILTNTLFDKMIVGGTEMQDFLSSPSSTRMAMIGWAGHARFLIRNPSEKTLTIYDPWKKTMTEKSKGWKSVRDAMDTAGGYRHEFEARSMVDQPLGEGSCALIAMTRTIMLARLGESSIRDSLNPAVSVLVSRVISYFRGHKK